ncbi:hypothetical protein BDV96DRAFT_601930 [Lophiotrema nucula]|uniref:Uncharacterized protein n=1 Tax=Lophiotrema nucula TaxID=690887 RepID=A0A6A5YZD7_9PLEO|nr:hypothetical protein BDV96DRAFT_601930 [Lophiotrema nucula]
MQLTLITQAAFAALTADCYIPFNDYRFFGNSTHDSASLIEAAINDPNLGWAEMVTMPGNAYKIWPETPTHEHVIEFCYQDQESMDGLSFFLRGPATSGTARLGNLGQDRDTHDGELEDPRARNWNNAFSGRTVVIQDTRRHLPNYKGAHATLGFIPETWNSDDGRHNIYMNPDNYHYIMRPSIFAHELGDHYVSFRCEGLTGYERVKQEASTPTPDRGPIAMEDICNSPNLGSQFAFAATEYSTEYAYHGKDEFGRDIFGRAPLTRWKNGGPNFDPPKERTADNSVLLDYIAIPSPGDVEAIKVLYPWNG